jgi:ketosteroid isomerase-like protein
MAGNTQSGSVAEARAGIQKAMDDLLAALRRGTTADEAYDLWYADDLVLTVAGDKTYRGLAQFRNTLSEWVKYLPVRWEIEDPIKADGNLAVAFVIETFPPREPEAPNTQFRALYVFEKGPKGWRACRQGITGPV